MGCGAGWAVVQLAERFPRTTCVGIDLEPYSVELAQRLIAERGLADRCQARLHSVDGLGEDAPTTWSPASWWCTSWPRP